MYRSANQWEAAERVARAHAPSNVQQQVQALLFCMYYLHSLFSLEMNGLSPFKVALQWAAVLGGASAARLLAARGLAALGARWAIQAQR